jgi:NADH:ubiquinone reductase (H+-translocating)
MATHPRVVIVGAGFGGLRLARELKHAPVEVLLVDRNNYHTFQPLLYQVATAALDPEEIGHNVRGIFHGQRNFEFRLGKVTGVDWQAHHLFCEHGVPIPFDYLVLAAGTVTNDFGIKGIEQYAFGLKSMEEAIDLRSHVMKQFEAADADPGLLDQGILNFVIGGGGPTGVEMAGSLAEWFHKVLRKDFPRLDVSRARVIAIEAVDTLLPPFAEPLRRNALETLRSRGVEVMLKEAVAEVTPNSVKLKSGKVIPTCTVIWSAGVKASPLGAALGLELTRGARVLVNPDLSVPNHPEVFVIGDMAASKDARGNLHPQLAQVALQGASHTARQIVRRIHGEPDEPFFYHDPGTMATIGRNAAVVQFPNGWKFTGFIAWLMWLFLHLMYLVGFRNRLNVFVNWLWNYITYDRSPRLILDHGGTSALKADSLQSERAPGGEGRAAEPARRR